VGGSLLLGVGTAQNNVPGSVAVLDLDGFGEFRTTLSGSTLPAFADTGSNALFFDPPSGVTIPPCGTSPPLSDFFCPTTAQNLVATNGGASGHGSAPMAFQIANFLQLPTSTNAVFSNLGGPGLGSGSFDWGLPFFLGRTVYIGFEGRTSPLGAGPCVAY
jgi:hypothetical protein